jgi:hypothetical protein
VRRSVVGRELGNASIGRDVQRLQRADHGTPDVLAGDWLPVVPDDDTGGVPRRTRGIGVGIDESVCIAADQRVVGDVGLRHHSKVECAWHRRRAVVRVGVVCDHRHAWQRIACNLRRAVQERRCVGLDVGKPTDVLIGAGRARVQDRALVDARNLDLAFKR